MTAGQVVEAPDGTDVVLVDIGQRVLVQTPVVRVWDVTLQPGELQPWHLHHNPYLVLSLEASPGRMDWLDGSEPRYLDEYVGGAVYRPTSPVHRLTNIGATTYRNRLVEFLQLGENSPVVVDVGAGGRSTRGEEPPGPVLPDGRTPVLVHRHATTWTVTVAPGTTTTLQLPAQPHVLAALERTDDQAAGVRITDGGPVELTNPGPTPRSYFVVELSHLADLDAARTPHQEAP